MLSLLSPNKYLRIFHCYQESCGGKKDRCYLNTRMFPEKNILMKTKSVMIMKMLIKHNNKTFFLPLVIAIYIQSKCKTVSSSQNLPTQRNLKVM